MDPNKPQTDQTSVPPVDDSSGGAGPASTPTPTSVPGPTGTPATTDTPVSGPVEPVQKNPFTPATGGEPTTGLPPKEGEENSGDKNPPAAPGY